MELLLGIRCQVINMRKVIANNRRRSKRGTTLVELIVSLTLTAMFAVICVMLINPIERIYQRTEKTARAQLLADTIVDSIRKECDGIKNDDINSVWIANGSFDADTASDQILFDPACSKRITSGLESNNKGTVLVIKKNNSYCEMIFASLPITTNNKTEANKNVLDGTYSGHAVDELFQGSAEDVAKNTGRGVVHFGYYGAGDKGNGVYPLKAYDYTNPLIASTYGDYHVKVYFQKLVTRTEEIDGVDHEFPSYVECEVKVYEGEYKAGDNTSALVYTRKAAISFSANGSRPGTSYVDPHHSTTEKKKNVKVTVVWDDNNNSSGMRPANVTVKLMNGTQVLAKRVVPANRNPYTFTFVNVKDVDVTVEQEPMAVDGYRMREIKKVNGGFIITNKANAIKLIPGPDFDANLTSKIKNVVSVTFGSEADLKGYIPNYDNASYYKVSINANGQLTDDYRMYAVKDSILTTKMRVYVISKDGSFLANEDCSKMFSGCTQLEHVTNIGSLETSNTNTMAEMFKNCSKMTQFDCTGLIDESTTLVSAESMFEGCKIAQECIFTNCDTSRITSMKRMFFNYSISSLASALGKTIMIDLSSFNFQNCTDMTEMFSNNVNEKTVIDEVIFPEGHKNMPNVASMEKMFYKGSGIKKVTNFNDMTCKELKSITCMFDYCSRLTELDLHDFKMPKCELQLKWGIANLNSAFKGCTKLETIILDGWQVETASNMRDFLSNSDSLKTVSLKNCYMPNIISVEGLFINDHVLETVEMAGFVCGNCRSVRSIFKECYKLKTIDISNWDTSNVDTMRDMFYMANKDCSKPLDVDLSGFSFVSATDFYRMFYQSGVSSVTFPSSSPTNPIIVGKYYTDPEDARVEQTPSHYSFSQVFYQCTRLTTVNNFNISYEHGVTCASLFSGCKLLGSKSGGKVKYYINMPASTSASSMFDGCSSLTEVDLSGSSLKAATNISSGFANCTNLTKLILDNVNLAAASNVDKFFNNTNNIETLQWNGIDLSSVTTMAITNKDAVKYIYLKGAKLTGLTKIEQLFQKRTKLITVDFSYVILPEGLDSAYQMFFQCEKLKNVNIDGLVAPRSLREMFRNCYSLKSIDVSKINASATESMIGMFMGCTSLVEVDFNGVAMDNMKTMDTMFSGCTLLEKVTFSTDTTKQSGPSDSATQIFSGCIYIKEVIGFKAPANCSEMFKDCYQTAKIELVNWDTSAVTNMSSMFYGCDKLETLDLSSFVTSSVTNMSEMFRGCLVLSFDSSKWTKWNTSNVTDMSYMFKDCCYDRDYHNDAAGHQALLDKDFCINISNFSFASLTNAKGMFTCGTTKNVDYKFDILDEIVMPAGDLGKAPNLTNAFNMFMWRYNTKAIDNLECFETPNLKQARAIFSRTGVSELDVRGMNFSNLDNTLDGSGYIFDNCESLVTIYADPAKNYVPKNGSGMFSNDKKIKGGAGTTYQSNQGDNKKYAIIDGSGGNKGYLTDYHQNTGT